MRPIDNGLRIDAYARVTGARAMVLASQAAGPEVGNGFTHHRVHASFQ
jgi:hypothetical protein